MGVSLSVPFNDLRRLHERFAPRVEAAVLDTLRSGRWLNGERTAQFAHDFAAFLGAGHCMPVANGTDALEIAMRALALEAAGGRYEVVMVANAGGYATTAARNAGFVPVYADIEPASQLLSIESAVSCLGDDTLAVVATHLYGGVVDVPRLRAALDDAGFERVPILEDCAQAHGASLGALSAGTMGDTAAFSFYPTKNLGAMGDAGAVVTGSAGLAARARALAQYGWSKKYTVETAGGRNSRMDEAQAAILSAILPDLGALNAERAGIAARYRSQAPLCVRFVESAAGSVTHLAVVLADDRDALRGHLAARGIASDVHYPVLDCDQPAWRGLPHRVAPRGLPVSRASVGRLLSLPCFVGMTEAEIAHVEHAMAEFGRP